MADEHADGGILIRGSLHNGLQFRILLRIAQRGKEIFRDQLADKAQALAIRVRHKRRGNLAVFHVQLIAEIAGESVVLERVHQEEVDVAHPAGMADQRDFVVRIAVAVRILLFEGLQHVVEFVRRGGNFEAEVIKPDLVDGHIQRACVGRIAVELRIGVDVAVRRGAVFQDVFLLLGRCPFIHRFIPIVSIVFKIIVQREKVALRAVREALGIGKANAQDIRERFAAGDHQGKLLLGFGAVGGQEYEIQLYAGFFFDQLREVVVFIVSRQRRGAQADGKGYVFGRQRQNAGFAQFQRERARDAQHQGKQNNKNPFHFVSPFKFAVS